VRQQDVAMAIVRARQAMPDKPVLAVLMGREGLPQGRAELAEVGIPAYIFPESAARALGAMHRQQRWLQRPPGEVRTFDVDGAAARAALAATPSEDGYLPGAQVDALLSAYGIPVVAKRRAETREEAAALASAIGFPVAAKILSRDIVHKTEVGGVVLDLRSEDEVAEAFDTIIRRARDAQPGVHIDGVAIEQFVRGGRETIIGMSHDPSFGPILMFGLGGIYVEALRDVTFRVQPVTDVDASEMIGSIRGAKLLAGVRGEAPSDTRLLAEVIQRVSQLCGDHPRIREMDINPFVVFQDGGVTVDARIRI
jgi:acetyltransferase